MPGQILDAEHLYYQTLFSLAGYTYNPYVSVRQFLSPSQHQHELHMIFFGKKKGRLKLF